MPQVDTRRVSTRALFLVVTALCAASLCAQAQGRLITREIHSEALSHNKIGTAVTRSMVAYLPEGYHSGTQRYPVIYFLPNPMEPSYRSVFDQHHMERMLDQAIASSRVSPFILVCIDMVTPIGNSWYVNSPVTGNWEDFMVKELVPDIDANFRTIANRDSRGITGIFMGAYGAIRFGMRHPETFGAVYGLHPVGTGSGVQIMHSRPNWELLSNAKSLDDIRKDGFSQLFTAIFQAHLPNPDRPPLYVDFAAQRVNGELVIDPKMTERLRNHFLLDAQVGQYADNLKQLRGLRFDWPRADSNYDHVYSAQAFSHILNEYGVRHEAEEYNGQWGDSYWGPDSRIVTEMLPFFGRKLVMRQPGSNATNHSRD